MSTRNGVSKQMSICRARLRKQLRCANALNVWWTDTDTEVS